MTQPKFIEVSSLGHYSPDYFVSELNREAKQGYVLVEGSVSVHVNDKGKKEYTAIMKYKPSEIEQSADEENRKKRCLAGFNYFYSLPDNSEDRKFELKAAIRCSLEEHPGNFHIAEYASQIGIIRLEWASKD